MLLAGAAVAAWGWRLELAGVALAVLVRALLAGLVGAVAAWLVVAALGAVLAVRASRRWVMRVLRAARVRRRWRRAGADCGLVSVRVARVTSAPAGELVRVRATRGSSLEAVAAQAEELAVCLGLRGVIATTRRPGR
jgi:hypothetical protein